MQKGYVFLTWNKSVSQILMGSRRRVVYDLLVKFDLFCSVVQELLPS